MHEKNAQTTNKIPIYIGLAISLGMLIGSQINDFDVERPLLINGYHKLKEVISYIENDYVDEVSQEKIVEELIEEMLAKLDPHSAYISTENRAITDSQLKGNFEGIGIEFNIFHDTIYVVTPLSGGPSEKLGIKPVDKIVKVNEENVAGIGLKTSDVVKRLRGVKGSTVAVYIYRAGHPELLNFTIERDVIPQFSVDASYMIDKTTGYIKVSRFSASTFTEFKVALDSLSKKGMNKLLLDLTGNPGGYMDRAVNMVDEFLDDGKMIVYTQGKRARFNNEHRATKQGSFKKGALIVLMDEGSASASEIVAGALQDHDRALIVGRRSFGKGLVQMPISLDDGSELRLTISRYYTPSGRCIQKPYQDNLADYNNEYFKRFSNGEMFVKDSIQLNDSLVYKTANGRVVYGGGGIVPDYFVAYDTSKNSSYLNHLFTSNTVAEYALNYSQDHENDLRTLGLDQFISEFELSQVQLDDLIHHATTNGVTFDRNDYENTKDQLKILVKAYIGRRIWNNEGFYPIFNEQNEIYVRAKKLFNQAAQLNASVNSHQN